MAVVTLLDDGDPRLRGIFVLPHEWNYSYDRMVELQKVVSLAGVLLDAGVPFEELLRRMHSPNRQEPQR